MESIETPVFSDKLEDIDIYFDLTEAELIMEYAKVNKRIAETNDAMYRFKKLISEKIIS